MKQFVVLWIFVMVGVAAVGYVVLAGTGSIEAPEAVHEFLDKFRS